MIYYTTDKMAHVIIIICKTSQINQRTGSHRQEYNTDKSQSSIRQ